MSLLGVLFFASSAQAQNDPSLKLKDPSSLDWFKEAKFGMFLHWGLYSELEGSWKSANEMLGLLVNNVSKGGNYLLNIASKADGTFPVMATRRLREMGAWLLVNGEAIYGTKPMAVETEKGVFLVEKMIGKERYAYAFLTQAVGELSLPFSSVKKCTILETGMSLDVRFEGGKTIIKIPNEQFRDCSIQVVKIMR